MTAYQRGFATGLRCRIARIPPCADRADRARWRSGFNDARQLHIAAKRNAARGFSFEGY